MHWHAWCALDQISFFSLLNNVLCSLSLQAAGTPALSQTLQRVLTPSASNSRARARASCTPPRLATNQHLSASSCDRKERTVGALPPRLRAYLWARMVCVGPGCVGREGVGEEEGARGDDAQGTRRGQGHRCWCRRESEMRHGQVNPSVLSLSLSEQGLLSLSSSFLFLMPVSFTVFTRTH